MTLTSLFGIIAAVALVIAIIKSAIEAPKSWIVAIISSFVGGLLIFSGGVKAIDPIGMAIKLEEYFEVFTEYLPRLKGLWHLMAANALPLAIFTIVLEIFLGVALLLGTYRRFTVWTILAMMVFFTFLTGFSHVTGKVTDCGCFGDFMKLTPYKSFIKDVILLVLTIILFIWPLKMNKAIFGIAGSSIVLWVLTLFALLFTIRNHRNLPIKDFRAYTVGTNIPDCLTLPEDAKPYIYENIFVYKNKATKENKEFVNTFPKDFENWEYVDRIDKLIQKGDDPKCKDFAIIDIDGVEVTDEFMTGSKPTLVINSYNLQEASTKGFERISEACKEAENAGFRVIAVTGSPLDEAEKYRHEVYVPFTFYNTDATPIKTMNRSNPGLTLLKGGTIKGKWHWRHLPDIEKLVELSK